MFRIIDINKPPTGLIDPTIKYEPGLIGTLTLTEIENVHMVSDDNNSLDTVDNKIKKGE